MNLVMNIFCNISPSFSHTGSDRVIAPIYIVACINALAYMTYHFLDFARPVDENDPLNRKDLYKVAGTCNKVKKLIFRACFAINTILAPIAALVVFIVAFAKLQANQNDLAQYMTSWLIMCLYQPISASNNFNALGKCRKSAPLEWGKFEEILGSDNPQYAFQEEASSSDEEDEDDTM